MDYLINIHSNFHKLLSGCTSTTIFSPPLFNYSSDIDALIVLNQIVDIVLQTKNQEDIKLSILRDTLKQIITIKCKEFFNCNEHNLSCFIESFYSYIQYIINDHDTKMHE